MIAERRMAEGVLECAIVVVAFTVSAEAVLNAIPVFGRATAHDIGLLRLILFAATSACLGFWVQRRYSLVISRAAIGLGVGVVVSFVVRALRAHTLEIGGGEEPMFLAGLAFANWIILLSGAVVGVFWKR